MLKKLIKKYKVKLLCAAVLIFLMPCFGFAAGNGNQGKTKNNDKPGDVASVKKKEIKYIYDPTVKTDPFKSFIAVREEKAKKERGKPKTYLETLELSQLDLSAIVISKEGRWAMVTDSKDAAHVIRVGTHIGTNGGVVYKIEPGEIIIREKYTDFKGEKHIRDIIKKPPSESQ